MNLYTNTTAEIVQEEIQPARQELVEQEHIYYRLARGKLTAEPVYENEKVIYNVEMGGKKRTIFYHCDEHYVTVEDENGEEVEKLILHKGCQEDHILKIQALKDIRRIIKKESKLIRK